MNKKIMASVIAVAFAFSMVGSTGAGAVTLEELQVLYDQMLANYNLLLAQVGQTTTTTGLCLTGDLSLGMTSAEVKVLQQGLNQDSATQVAISGAGASGYETSYFGALTKAAVIKFQNKYASEVLASWGLTKGTGYAGSTTRAKFNALYCTPVAPTTTTTVAPAETTTTTIVAALTGGAGSVVAYEIVSGLSNEEVGEGENDVVVAGIEIKADEGSDLRITAVQLTFDEGDANRDFDKYADEVSVWLGSNEVARVDADTFDDDNNWIRTVTLSGENIILAEATGILYVKVSGINNLDSNDDGETWDVDYTAIRFMDALGATISEDPGTAAVVFSFETYATAADIELKLALDIEDINDAHILNIDDTNDTENVSVLSFTLEVEGDSDIIIDEIPVLITLVGMNIDDAISTAYLYADGDKIGTENLTADDLDETVTFDDLDFTIDAGDTVSFLVKLDINDLDATGGAEVAEGDTIQAQVTRAGIDAEDESGEDLVDATDMTGSAVGDAHAIYDVGIMVELVSVSALKTLDGAGASTPVDDQATYTIVVDITAFDDDIYIPHNADDTALDAGDAFSFGYTVTDGTVTSTAAQVLDSNGGDGTSAWEIDEDSTDRFTLTVTLIATTGTADFASIALNGIGWGIVDQATSTNDYSFNLDAFKTGSVFVTAQ